MDLLDLLDEHEAITDRDRAWVTGGTGRVLVRHTATGALGWARERHLPIDEYEPIEITKETP